MGCLFSKKSCVKNYRRDQTYAKIRKHYSKLSHNLYFKDLKFPASDSILTVGTDIPRNIEWKRPNDLSESPLLVSGLLGDHTVTPGILSPAWISSALALLSHRPELWHWVVPQYRLQCWGEDPTMHPGVFHFRLWYRGAWVDVVIDDQLPILDGDLVCAQSSCKNEWWPSLLEKAYAKLLGSYAALKSVSLSDVLVDLTGGVSEIWTVPTKVNGCNGDHCADEQDCNFLNLFLKLKTEIAHQTLVTAYVRKEAVEEESSDRTSLGLILEQPYLIVSVKRIHLENSALKGILKGKEKVILLRLCNPAVVIANPQDAPPLDAKNEAGTSEKPDFVFTHKHLTQMLSKVPEWARLSEEERQKLGLAVDNDREFWIPAEDFVTQFGELCVCRILGCSGAPLACVMGEQNWREKELSGAWDLKGRGGSGRGSGRSTPTQNLLQNPQFVLDIPSDKGANVVIQLLQWPSATMESQDYPPIGFSVFKVEENRKYRLHALYGHSNVLTAGPLARREVNNQCHLSHGRYLIIAQTEAAGPTSSAQLHVPKHSFLLRCFITEGCKLFPADRDLPTKHWWHPFAHDVQNVSVVSVKGAEDLKYHSSFFKCNPYCVIKCEGVSVETKHVEHDNNPSWEGSYVFYRRTPAIPMSARVYSHRPLIPDVLLGQAQILAPVNHQSTIIRADLGLPGYEDETPRGILVLEVITEDDLNAI
ncbi:calpain-5-like [Neocloeon triangulifer]|uniref:calpain-5-like n=1 Tax=Neocloeon triangulifer TaxID=2078957 RepID=UPI00286F1E7E|nr:calpain-5-like [Neocloeon triangulifer]